jgi:hypothetical protein
MAVIDPHGLFNGERLRACSDRAQDLWPRLYIACNNFARMQLDPDEIIRCCFGGYRVKPTREQLLAVIAEYRDNFLVLPYKVSGRVWLQFATQNKWLRHHKSAIDKNSPEPSPKVLEAFDKGYARWKENRTNAVAEDEVEDVNQILPPVSKTFSTISEPVTNVLETVSEKVTQGIGIGIGIGIKPIPKTAAAEDAASRGKKKPNKAPFREMRDHDEACR